MQAERQMPTFIIIGAAKSGTTALYRWLAQHPQVWMSPIKQPHYFADLQPHFRGPGDELFNREIVTDLQAYRDLFAPGADRPARGEASPFYLYYAERAASRIRREIPECRLIVLLREPVARAYSGYLHLVRDGRESATFRQALEREGERLRAGWEPLWAHRGLGQYARQLQVFLDLFPREQIGVWLYEEMRQPQRLFQEVCRFIGVDDRFVPRFTHHNVGGAPRSPALHALLVKLRVPHIAKAVLPEAVAQWVVGHYLQHRPPPLDVAQELHAGLVPELRQLQRLVVEKSLETWMQPPQVARAG